MFEIRTNFYSTLITSLLATCLYYSNLYSRIEQFVKFLCKNYILTRTSLMRNCAMRIKVVNCICKLRL